MDISQMPWGPDVSHWKPVRDWVALAASGATFFGAKATEGAHAVDDQFERHRDGFRANCPSFTMAIWYHFFHAETDPSTQAEHFADVVGPLQPRERLCCDFEGKSYSSVPLPQMRAFGLRYLLANLGELRPRAVLEEFIINQRPLEIAEKNATLNGWEVEWIEANDFDLLKDYASSGRQYDTIALDPPAFAKTKRDLDKANTHVARAIERDDRLRVELDDDPARTTGRLGDDRA